jgi:hypothetical protein
MDEDGGRAAQDPHRGVARTGLWAYFVATAYNLLRLAKLHPTPA